MSSLTLTIEINDASGAMKVPARTVEALREMRGAARACAEGALPVYERHMRDLSGSNRNKFGVRGGFWNRMLSGTKAGGTDSSGFIRMPREVGARRYGATITPKKGKFLAIPARAEAYGKSPRQFNDLRFVPTRRGGMLVKSEPTSGPSLTRSQRIGGNKKGQGGAFYFLVPRAVIPANPAIFPADAAVLQAAGKAGLGWLQLQVRRRNSWASHLSNVPKCGRCRMARSS